ncbi:hypothetical protein BDQ17DRAFT_1369146 [Cyathus striatus]|nr:hypothetical protein BDQ17DRAFT_1369146 [Cyathus striatus]
MSLSLLNTLSSYLKYGYRWLFLLKENALKAAIPGKSSKHVEADTCLHEITRVISSRLVSEKLKFAILLDDSSAIIEVHDSRVSRWGVDRISLPGGPNRPTDLYSAIGYLTHYHSFLNLEPLHDLQQTGIASLDITRLGPITGVTHPSLRHPDSPNLVTDGIANIIADPKIPYGFRITNNSDWDLYAYLYFLDNQDFSIAPYYISQNIPLKARQSLTIGYGTNPGPPAYAYFLREGTELEVGFLKLLLSKKPLEGILQIEQHATSNSSDKKSIQQLEAHICEVITVTIVQRKSQV